MIEVRDLYKYYGDRRALGPVSFDIAQGEIVGFLGLNGSGKTTCLRILAGDLLPSGGAVRVDGADLTTAPIGARARVGFLPDTPPVYPEMTVTAYLRFAGRLRAMTKADVVAGLPSLLEHTGLTAVADEPVGNLSHGYRQRVGIAQAVIHRPRLLVLDEPFSGLDPVQIVEMRQMITSERLGVGTILVSSHILPEISETCDRILMIRDGEIAAVGTEAELSARLLGGARVEISARGEADALLAALRAVEGVQDARVTAAPIDGVCEILVETRGDAREALSRALVAGGFGLRRLDPAERELESVFIELTRGKASA